MQRWLSPATARDWPASRGCQTSFLYSGEFISSNITFGRCVCAIFMTDSNQQLSHALVCLYRDVQEGCELCRTNVGPGGYQLSLNPLNWRQMCVMGANKLTFYSLEQCNDDQLMLTAQSVLVN